MSYILATLKQKQVDFNNHTEQYDDMNKTKKVGDLLESGGTLGSYGYLLGSAFSAYINECDKRFGILYQYLNPSKSDLGNNIQSMML